MLFQPGFTIPCVNMEKNDPLQPESRPPDDADPPADAAPDGDDSGAEWIDLEEPESPTPGGARIDPSGEASPIPLEEPASEPSRGEGSGGGTEYVHSLDVCSNCGASMRDKTMVCLRCGWNMRTGRVETVKTGVVEVDEQGREESEGDEESTDEPARATPLSEPGRGGVKAPLIVAAVAVGLLFLANVLNFSGLYPHDNPPDGFGSLLAAFSSLAKLVLGVCCGLLALSFLGWLLKAQLGELSLAAARMLAIVGVVMLVEIVDMPWVLLERVVELAIQAALFTALSAYFFKLSLRDAATLTLSFIMAAIAIVAVTGLVGLVT